MCGVLITGFDFLSRSVHSLYRGKAPVLWFLFLWLYMALDIVQGWLFTLLLLLQQHFKTGR